MTENIGGMETYLIEQYRHLNHEVVTYDFVNITADRSIAFANEIFAKGNKIFSICRRSKNPIKHYWDWFRLLWGHNEYDAIVLNACHLYYVFPLVIGKVMGIKKRIMHSHNAGDEIVIGCLRKLIIAINKKLLFWCATDYWACSALAGQWMFGDKDFKVIHNAIDVDKFRFNPEIRTKKRKELGLDKEFVIGHVGRFTYQKNHKFLINVFSEICRFEPDAVLLLIGNAVENDVVYLNNAKEQVEKLNLQKKVRFLGLRQDVNELMQAMDCFVFPSHFEGLPIVGLEVQAAALPSFFSDAISKTLEITSLAHFYALDNPELWARKIIQEKVKLRVDTWQDIINNGYDINNEVKEIEKFYFQIS
jgi:glycosyltransferase involved in cell wall biosynthesis